MARARYTIAIDFDGVIHDWDGTNAFDPTDISGPMIPGALEFLHKMLHNFDVVILSARARTWRGRRAIRRWLKNEAGMMWYENGCGCEGFESIKVTAIKPPALMYVDDRAHRFTGSNFPTPHEVHMARPWNR